MDSYIPFETVDGSDSSTRLVGNGDAGNDLLTGSSANDTLKKRQPHHDW